MPIPTSRTGLEQDRDALATALVGDQILDEIREQRVGIVADQVGDGLEARALLQPERLIGAHLASR